MTWNVTYRDKEGKQTAETIDADSRESLFEVLADRGINAVRIEEAKAGQPRRSRTARSSNLRKASIWVVVSVAAVVTAIIAMHDSAPKQDGKGTKKKVAIKDVSPSLPIPSKPETNTTVKAEDRNSLEWLKKHDKRYIVPEDAVRRPNGRLYTKDGRRILEKLPARTIRADAGRKRVFEHQAEREIARLLSIEPGKFFIGNSNYGPKFKQSFAEAVASPTPILEDDDEATIALKKEVNEVKADLAQRLKDGEDIVEIMKNTEKELRTLATFRNDMMKELTALRFDESVTEQDYKDFVTAANRMLKERGLKELSSPVFAEAQLKYIREVHKAKQAAKTAREAPQQSN